MKCKECVHKLVCAQMVCHVNGDRSLRYLDLNNIEEYCNHYAQEILVKHFPCYVGQKLWMIKDVVRNNVNTGVIKDVYVISIRYRNALASDVIDSRNTEETMQIFVGPEDSYQLTELSDKDFGKKLFYNETEAQKYLEEAYGKEN